MPASRIMARLLVWLRLQQRDFRNAERALTEAPAAIARYHHGIPCPLARISRVIGKSDARLQNDDMVLGEDRLLRGGRVWHGRVVVAEAASVERPGHRLEPRLLNHGLIRMADLGKRHAGANLGGKLVEDAERRLEHGVPLARDRPDHGRSRDL